MNRYDNLPPEQRRVRLILDLLACAKACPPHNRIGELEQR